MAHRLLESYSYSIISWFSNWYDITASQPAHCPVVYTQLMYYDNLDFYYSCYFQSITFPAPVKKKEVKAEKKKAKQQKFVFSWRGESLLILLWKSG